jgi:glycosyltransferase involved in cell wall biosynthesis
MRLLHVVPSYLPAVRYGGPIVAVHGLCRALAARGHEVEVFTTSVDGSQDSVVALDRPVMLDGVRVHYFASRRLRRLYFAPALGRALIRDVAGADIVHLHSVFLWPTWRAARIAERAGVPYVLSPRGMLVKKLIASRNRLIKSAWLALIEKSTLARATALHATSELEAEEIQKFGWRLPRIAVVPNGAEDIDDRAGSGEPSAEIVALGREQPLILFFGRMARVKGLDRLLRAFARTKRGVLAIVGTDFEGLAPELKRFASELKLDHRVRFVPRTVTGVDKERIFASARLFVLPSYSESFGNAVVEALQRGVPVIVTPEVGAAEVVRESGGGLVVDGGAGALGDAIDWLTEDPARAAAMGQAGRRHVSSRYSWQSIAERMEALYEELRRSR